MNAAPSTLPSSHGARRARAFSQRQSAAASGAAASGAPICTQWCAGGARSRAFYRAPSGSTVVTPKKKKTGHKPARGKFVLDPDDISFNLDIKLVPQSEDDRLYALRLRDARYCMKDASEEERQAIENMPRDEYLATRTQEDRDELKNEICQYQADILCNARLRRFASMPCATARTLMSKISTTRRPRPPSSTTAP